MIGACFVVGVPKHSIDRAECRGFFTSGALCTHVTPNILADPRFRAVVSTIVLLMFPAGLVLGVVHSQLYASFAASDLPECVLNAITVREIFGYEITLNPGHMATFFGTWVSPSVVFAGLADLKTYGLDRWTTRLRNHPHAIRLLSSLWMQESRLDDYYQLINCGFRSRQRRIGWHGR